MSSNVSAHEHGIETIEDIVRELREEPLAENGARPWVHYLADRIEKAMKVVDDSLRWKDESLDICRSEKDRLIKRLAVLEKAMHPILRCPACSNFTPEEQASHCMKAVADSIHVYCQGGTK